MPSQRQGFRPRSADLRTLLKREVDQSPGNGSIAASMAPARPSRRDTSENAVRRRWCPILDDLDGAAWTSAAERTVGARRRSGSTAVAITATPTAARPAGVVAGEGRRERRTRSTARRATRSTDAHVLCLIVSGDSLRQDRWPHNRRGTGDPRFKRFAGSTRIDRLRARRRFEEFIAPDTDDRRPIASTQL